MPLVSSDESCSKVGECVLLDRPTHAPHQIEIEMQIVNADQAKSQNLLRL
jgi:hypothetical protein